MGVTGLELFIRKKVPNGCIQVDIRNEIRNYKPTTSPTTIVIDFQSLYEPACKSDFSGILCGGRYNFAFHTVDQFLREFQKLGVKLVFFNDGVFKSSKNQTNWPARHDLKYDRELQIIDSVDNGEDVGTVVSKHRRNIPSNTLYPLKMLAKRYGEIRQSVAGETKKEMVAYANSVNALAVISNNSDMLIFGGNWRFWSSKDLSFENLTTREFSRSALRTHLELDDQGQLALFATLASNNGFIKSEELASFNRRYFYKPYAFQALAKFVRRPHANLLVKIFGQAASVGDLGKRFQKSLDYYGLDCIVQERPPSENPTQDFLQENGKTFPYKMVTGEHSRHPLTFVDLRGHGLGSEYPNLLMKIILREAAITVYHCRDHLEPTNRTFIHKISHEIGYAAYNYELEFPQHIEQPTLQELLSTDSETHAKLADTKLKLYCWIISARLDHRQLGAIPPKLMPTVATLYFLVEHQVLELFEADLLLYVAHDVVFKSYDMFNVRYPQYLDGRAFRVAFLYNAICQHVLKALNVIGLDGQEFPEYPQFDGVRFHNLYQGWSRGDRNLERIQSWRIYENIM